MKKSNEEETLLKKELIEIHQNAFEEETLVTRRN